MRHNTLIPRKSAAVLLSGVMAASLLSGCGNSSGPASGLLPGTGNPTTPTAGRKFLIKPGANATSDMVAAMIQAAPGDVIEFDCGFFDLTSTFQLTDTEDVLVKGCGKDKTVLSFANNNAPEGVLAVNVRGVTYQDFTVADTGGNGFELRGVDHATLQRVRAIWSSGGGRESPDRINAGNFQDRLHVPCTDPPTQDPSAPENEGGDTTSPDYTVSPKSGRYGIYPVSSENILIDDAESVGASDAGIYVGQTNTAIIRNSRAAYNVFGFEIENVQGGEYDNNLAECNTGGFLVYDLDGLRQYGGRTIIHNNIARNNNTYNFTSGGIVGSVPPGSGMITLAYDQMDIFDNLFENNNTAGIIHTSYEIFPEGAGRPAEKRIDWYTEGVHIFRNTFKNNGNALPIATTNAIADGDVAKLLPALVGAKNQAACAVPTNTATCAAAGGANRAATGFRGAHILWDGLLDSYDAECPYPKQGNGEDVPKDSRGKPIHTNEDPNPACHYNAYKFDTSQPSAPRIQPEWFASCIDADNEFSADSLKFANFKGTKGANAAIKIALGQAPSPQDLQELQDLPSSFDLAPHNCKAAYGKDLPLLPPVVIPPFVRSGLVDPAPAQELIDRLCGKAMAAGEVNFEAGKVNCPTLDQYNLFSDPQDPTSTPNGGGVPYSLNSKLFSDYSVKYRVLYMPPGTKAVYRDAATDGANATIVYPAGTILAKTFSFADEDAGTETPSETRLLIKRVATNGQPRWQGMSYIWSTENGKKVAKLAMGGGTQSVSWKHTDVDSGVLHTGSTPNYLIPNANQCLSCHSREDAEPGSAPIGTKVRFMNKAFAPESRLVTGQSQHEIAGKNQVDYLCNKGLLMGCPSDRGVDVTTQVATRLEKSPVFNKPGSSGFTANSAEDVEARARAWLEVNCQHCHNVRGFASNTGFYVDAFRPVDTTYGICKRPTATGQEGSGGRVYDIHPGRADNSIVAFRTSAEATLPAARMPPLARSVVDTEGHALIEQWINDVVKVDAEKYPGSSNCN